MSETVVRTYHPVSGWVLKMVKLQVEFVTALDSMSVRVALNSTKERVGADGKKLPSDSLLGDLLFSKNLLAMFAGRVGLTQIDVPAERSSRLSAMLVADAYAEIVILDGSVTWEAKPLWLAPTPGAKSVDTGLIVPQPTFYASRIVVLPPAPKAEGEATVRNEPEDLSKYLTGDTELPF